MSFECVLNFWIFIQDQVPFHRYRSLVPNNIYLKPSSSPSIILGLVFLNWRLIHTWLGLVSTSIYVPSKTLRDFKINSIANSYLETLIHKHNNSFRIPMRILKQHKGISLETTSSLPFSLINWGITNYLNRKRKQGKIKWMLLGEMVPQVFLMNLCNTIEIMSYKGAIWITYRQWTLQMPTNVRYYIFRSHKFSWFDGFALVSPEEVCPLWV